MALISRPITNHLPEQTMEKDSSKPSDTVSQTTNPIILVSSLHRFPIPFITFSALNPESGSHNNGPHLLEPKLIH